MKDETHSQNDFFQETLALTSDFLRRGESCFLPEIGVLKREFESAIEQEEQILPSRQKIILLTGTSAAEHNIIEEIKTAFQLSAGEAKKVWNGVFNKLKDHVTTDRPFLFPGIGTLKKGAEGGFEFDGFIDREIYDPFSWSDDTGEDSAYPFEEEGSSKKRSSLFIGLMVAILLLLVLFVYLFFINRFWEPSENRHTPPASTEDTTTALSPATAQETKDSSKAEKDDFFSRDSIRFAVIFKTFDSREKAGRYHRKMIGWGHQVKVYTKDSTKFLVGYPYYAPPADTANEKDEIQDIYGVKTFVIFPEKQSFEIIFD